MRDASATEKFHHCLVQQMALYARYDRLDEGVLGKKFLSLEQIWWYCNYECGKMIFHCKRFSFTEVCGDENMNGEANLSHGI